MPAHSRPIRTARTARCLTGSCPVSDELIHEVCRWAGAEMHSIASVMGGIASQVHIYVYCLPSYVYCLPSVYIFCLECEYVFVCVPCFEQWTAMQGGDCFYRRKQSRRSQASTSLWRTRSFGMVRAGLLLRCRSEPRLQIRLRSSSLGVWCIKPHLGGLLRIQTHPFRVC
jgi:hypothetical protein